MKIIFSGETFSEIRAQILNVARELAGGEESPGVGAPRVAEADERTQEPRHPFAQGRRRSRR